MKTAIITQPSKQQSAILKSPLDSFIPPWLNDMQLRVDAREMKPDTAITYKRGVMKFTLWLADESPSAETIRRWKASLMQNNIKPASVNAWLAGLRSFFSWLAEQGEIPFNPTQAIKGASMYGTRKKHSRDALTDQEVISLLAQPDRSKHEGKRDYAILSTMLYTAARGIEIHRANIEDLRTADGALVLYVQGKGHDEKDDFLILSAEAESAVRDWLSSRGNNPGALFVSLSNFSKGKRLSRRALREIVKGYMNEAGIQGNKTVHSLRHTAITNAIRHNVPIHKVKGMSRHSSLDTLMIYFHEVDRLSDPAEGHINYRART